MSDYFDRVERQLIERIDAGARPDRLSWPAPLGRRRPAPRSLRPAAQLLPALAAVLVVVVVGAVFLTGHRGSADRAGARSPGLSYTVVPTASGGSVSAAVSRSGKILRARLHDALPGARVAVAAGGAAVRITLPGRRITPQLSRQIAVLTEIGQVQFYDWEASVLTPSGQTAAAGLSRRDPHALLLSEGGANTGGPGAPGAGSTSAADALRLAARQPADGTGRAHYYAISAGCAAARLRAPRTTGCSLVGPASDPAVLRNIAPPAFGPLAAPVRVPAGVTVVQSASPNPASLAASIQFFVLRGSPALNGSDLVDPTTSTDARGEPDVTFQFTSAGVRRFRQLTANISHRGELTSPGVEPLFQHFAVILDGRLLTVPYIDFREDPDGVRGARSADITGDLTPADARDLTAVLRFGPLPAYLTPR